MFDITPKNYIDSFHLKYKKQEVVAIILICLVGVDKLQLAKCKVSDIATSQIAATKSQVKLAV